MVGDSVIVPGWSAPNDTSAGKRPGRNRRGRPRVRRRIGIATRQQVLIHRLRHGRGKLQRNVVLDTDGEARRVSGTKSPSASVATMTDEKLMAISASSLSLVSSPWSSWSKSVNVYAPVAVLVICSVNTWRSPASRTPGVAPLSTNAVSRLPVTL